MKSLLFIWVIIISHQLFSQTGSINNSIFITDSVALIRATEEIDTKICKNNLLQIIQQEFCFWNDPVNRIETEDESVSEIKKYWSCLNFYPSTKQIKNTNWQDRYPWSSAFISWCMKSAGYGNYFFYAPNHAKYIRKALFNKNNNDTLNPFWAYDIVDVNASNPLPGDLLCKNREGKRFSLVNIQENSISHCDVVIDVDDKNGIIVTIGGNVSDKVNKRWVFLDNNGYIDLNAAWLSFDANGISHTGSQKDFFAIIKVK